MFDTIAPRYERVNRIISLGLDARWRRKCLASAAFPPDACVIDLATGTGDFCRLLQAGGRRPIGVDFSLGMLRNATTDAPLIQADALRLPMADGTVDGVVCGFALRNFVDLPLFFAEMARVARAGARIGLLDAARPTSRLARAGHRVYFGRVVPLIGAALSDASAYRYLPSSLTYLPERTELIEMIRSAGFTNVEWRSLTWGAAQLITGTRS